MSEPTVIKTVNQVEQAKSLAYEVKSLVNATNYIMDFEKGITISLVEQTLEKSEELYEMLDKMERVNR